jgi:hypothetical protein
VSVAARPQPDLATRVASRKQELIAEILEHKKNSSRIGAAAVIDQNKARLSELANIVKNGAVDDWAKVGPAARRMLDEWVAR